MKNPNSLINKIEDQTLRAIRLLELTGAKITKNDNVDDLSEALKLFPNEKFEVATNRNDGLISITEKGKDETRRWMEGEATIDILNMKVSNDCYFVLENVKEYQSSYEVEEEELNTTILDKTSLDMDFLESELSFDEFRFFEKFCDEIEEGGYDGAVFKNGEVLMLIN